MNNRFEGWYFKQQNASQTVALIPALHQESSGQRAASLQIITDDASYIVPFAQYQLDRRQYCLTLGDCIFTPNGCRLHLQTDRLTVRGDLRYAEHVRLPFDVMGPFRFIPFVQCRHSVFSMRHRVDGILQINDRVFRFDRAPGYAEGDRGYSFPDWYIWTQCHIPGGSLMLSAAQVRCAGLHFSGCTGAVLYRHRLYRFATYCGARILHANDHGLMLRQGPFTITAQLLQNRSLPLLAPQNGSMRRVIHESVACRVRYRLLYNGDPLFDVSKSQAGFEAAGFDDTASEDSSETMCCSGPVTRSIKDGSGSSAIVRNR